MKRTLVALAAVLIMVAGCGTTGQTPVASPTAAPAKLTAGELAALAKFSSASLKVDDAARLLHRCVFAGSDSTARKTYLRAVRLLVGIDPYVTDDAFSLTSGHLDQAARAYEAFQLATVRYARAILLMYLGKDTSDRVMNGKKAVNAARDYYLASIKALNL